MKRAFFSWSTMYLRPSSRVFTRRDLFIGAFLLLSLLSACTSLGSSQKVPAKTNPCSLVSQTQLRQIFGVAVQTQMQTFDNAYKAETLVTCAYSTATSDILLDGSSLGLDIGPDAATMKQAFDGAKQGGKGHRQINGIGDEAYIGTPATPNTLNVLKDNVVLEVDVVLSKGGVPATENQEEDLEEQLAKAAVAHL